MSSTKQKCNYCGGYGHSHADHPCNLCFAFNHKTEEHICKLCNRKGHSPISICIQHANCRGGLRCKSKLECIHIILPECHICKKKGHDTKNHICRICHDTSHIESDHKCKHCKSLEHTSIDHPKCKLCQSNDHLEADHPCYRCYLRGHDCSKHQCKYCNSLEHDSEKHVCLTCNELGHGGSCTRYKNEYYYYCVNKPLKKCDILSDHKCNICSQHGHDAITICRKCYRVECTSDEIEYCPIIEKCKECDSEHPRLFCKEANEYRKLCGEDDSDS
jgi:hypothetical protein